MKTVDVKICRLKERESKNRQWPWLEIVGVDEDNKIIIIHYYPWDSIETQTLEVGNTYTLDLYKEKQEHYILRKIRAELV